MFRLVFLAFHGERRLRRGAGAPRQRSHAPSHAATAHQRGHGHARTRGTAWRHGHLHDAPPAMALALIVLAIGSVARRLRRRPGGARRQQPDRALPASELRRPRRRAASIAKRTERPRTVATGRRRAPHRRTRRASRRVRPPRMTRRRAGHAEQIALERTLMLVSSVVAFVGIGLAWYFFISRPSAADAVAASAAPLYRLLLHKYLRRRDLRRGHRAADQAPVDRPAVEGRRRRRHRRRGERHGRLRQRGQRRAAALQTGSVRVYAASLFLGVVAVLGYYLWRF